MHLIHICVAPYCISNNIQTLHLDPLLARVCCIREPQKNGWSRNVRGLSRVPQSPQSSQDASACVPASACCTRRAHGRHNERRASRHSHIQREKSGHAQDAPLTGLVAVLCHFAHTYECGGGLVAARARLAQLPHALSTGRCAARAF